MMVVIGGGIIFIDDKARGLHEGYLVTPITKLELIMGFTFSGTVKAVMAGMVLMTIGSVLAGVVDYEFGGNRPPFARTSRPLAPPAPPGNRPAGRAAPASTR